MKLDEDECLTDKLEVISFHLHGEMWKVMDTLLTTVKGERFSIVKGPGVRSNHGFRISKNRSLLTQMRKRL